MLHCLSIFLIVCFIIYLFPLLRFYYGLFQLRSGTNSYLHSISVIVPARNEAKTIVHCLFSLIVQDYPCEKVEIIVVNDHSQDDTEAVVRRFMKDHPQFRLLTIDDPPVVVSPKKHAISRGIKVSNNELIFTIDADCIAHPQWLRTMVKYFEQDVGLVTGLVLFDPNEERTLFHKIQSLEFLSLVIIGAGSIGSNVPIIGNGANLTYRRSVFQELDGFKGIDHLPSGDDDLFIQKVARQTRWKIRCAAEKSAIILTRPVDNLAAFLNQRTRWASKGIHYQSPLLVLYLILVYLFYLLLFILLPLSWIQFKLLSTPFILFSLKLVFDFLFMVKGTKLIGRVDLLLYFFWAELFQIPYILIVGIAGLCKKFTWKGR